MVKKYMNGYSTSLIIRKMLVKTTMRYHLTHIRMAIIKKTSSNKCRQEFGKKETHIHCWWKCRFVQPLWKIAWKIIKKLQIVIPHAPAILFQGVYQKKMKLLIRKDIYNPTITAALFTMVKIWKQHVSTDEWVDREDVVYMWCICIYAYTYSIYVEYYLAMKKNGILPYATAWTDLEGIMLSERSQAGKDKYHIISFTCGI